MRLSLPQRELNRTGGGTRMLTGLQALEATDWTKLHHAYGRAIDTPGHLRALLDGDAAARKAAMTHLWSAVIHQGTPCTATGPAALVVAGMMADERIGSGDPPVRPDLIAFLVRVAEASIPSDWTMEQLEQLEQLASYDIHHLLASDDEGAVYEDDDAASVAVVGITSRHCIDHDWGPLLAAAFRDGSGAVKTEAQRRFLGALVNQADLWNRGSTLGNALKWFEKAGLPFDRGECERRMKGG
jgi:hypothetical protein